jgi:hypothetical protein
MVRDISLRIIDSSGLDLFGGQEVQQGMVSSRLSTVEVVNNRIYRPRWQLACLLLSPWFLAQLIFFDPEDGGDIFLRNAG